MRHDRNETFLRQAFWRDLRGNRRFAVLYCISLSLGLFSFGLLSSVQNSVTEAISQRSREILTADLAVGSRVGVADEVLQRLEAKLPVGFRRAQKKSFFSMARIGASSRLVDVQAIDRDYPIYGDIILGRAGAAPKGAGRDFAGQAWVSPELLTQTGSRIGDTIRLGQKDYLIADEVSDDVAVFFGAVAMAPRVYVSLDDIDATGLLQFGSTVTQTYLFALPGTWEGEPLTALAKELQSQTDNNAVRVQTHMDSGQGTARLYDNLSDYLSLVALTALFLAGLAVGFLVRSFVQEKLPDIAVMSALGLSLRRAVLLYILEVLALAAAASVVAWLLSALALPWFHDLIRGFVTIEFTPTAGLGSFLTCFSYALVVSILGLVPTLKAVTGLKPARLLLGEAGMGQELQHNRWLYLPMAAAVWLMAVHVSGSWKIGSAFSGGILAAILVLTLASAALMRLMQGFFGSQRLATAFAARTVVRYRLTSYLAVLSLGLCFVLLTLIPQVESAIREEFIFGADERPDFFLFDVQDDQVESLRQEAAARDFRLEYLSPMIRARLTGINGTELASEAKEEAEAEGDEGRRVRGRAYNLTFRDGLFPSEKVVEGPAFSDAGLPAAGMPMISLEERFAGRLGVGIGDTLTFDVSGVAVEGRVVNLRSVRWVSFQPNFFVVFQPGVLDDAPKTWIAGVLGVPADGRDAFQLAAVEKFPNVSMIDVTKVSAQLTELIGAMGAVLDVMAVLAIFSGLMLLLVLVNFHVRRREWEYTLLRALGVSNGGVSRTIMLEIMALMAMGAFVGAVVSIGVANALSFVIFQRGTPFASLLFASLITVALAAAGLVAFIMGARVNRVKPRAILEVA